MNDHTPEIRVASMDLGKGLHETLEMVRKAFGDAANEFSKLNLGIVGDAKHLSNHYHVHSHTRYGMTGVQRAIWYAQDDLYDAEWLTDREYRHRAIKAARDELRRLRKLEIVERGWKR